MKQRRDVARRYSFKQFASKINRFLQSTDRGGSFRIQVGGKRITIPKNAQCSIEHERGGCEEELEFQITWKTSKTK